ncbi:MAG: chromosome segregation protein SMC [Pseudomonadales bacterium]|nr:chromosome segregation protein SMC [Pseudomonadales bacterium]
MRLKSIKLAGFKSFVDPTTVNFPSNLCAVVGPNGCGKSNIIDAVRWVMGESSAKNLRGEQMTDVIFNGSSNRKPVGQASVELIFDNSDRKITGEYASFNEISVRRMVTSDAQSSYMLNGTRCRRRDITDIFLGTGLGPRSYSIIEQGMVTRLIESKPEELRVFIEEAAGISKYKERRRETESRIKRTRENLERLTDIRDELERQLQHLQRQAKAAEKYREYKQQERDASAQLNALRWQALDTEVGNGQQVIASLEVKLEASIAGQRSLDAQIEQLRADNADGNEVYQEVQASFYGLGSEIARIEQSIEYQKQRRQQLEEDLRLTSDGLERSQQELQHDRDRIRALEDELSDVAPGLELARTREEASAAAQELAEQTMSSWQQEWDQFNTLSAAAMRNAEMEQQRISHLENIVERGMQRKQKLEAEKQSLLAEPEEEQIAVLDESILLLAEQQDAAAAASDTRTDDIEETRNLLKTLAANLAQERSKVHSLQGRMASLEALQQAALGKKQGSAGIAWLSRNKLDQNPRLVDDLKVVAGWEQAVETVLGEHLQAVCVNGLEPLLAALDSFSDGHLSLLDTSQTAIEFRADGELAGHALLSKIKNPALVSGLLAGIYCAENLSEAMSWRSQLQAHESLVTREGIWLGKDWLRLARGFDEKAGMIQRQEELSLLDQEIERAQAGVDELAAQQEEQQQKLHVREREKEELLQELGHLNRQIAERNAERAACLQKIEQVSERRKRLTQELAELARQVETEKANIAGSRVGLQQALDGMAADTVRREELLRRRDEHRSLLDQNRQQARHDKDQTHQLALRHQTLLAQISSLNTALERVNAQVASHESRQKQLLGALAQVDEPLPGLQRNLEEKLTARLEVEARLTASKSRVDAIDHEIRTFERQRQEAQEATQSIRDRLVSQRLGLEGASVKRSALSQQLAESGYDLETVVANLAEDFTQELCERELESLSGRIQRLGPINLAAIDEYATQSERKVYLDSQNDDLEKALATLENAIRKIDKETRTRFKETFDKINSSLQDLFPKVFGGGHAYLDLMGDDLLDTGVAIMARPPGKKNSTIHLLSGGEKAMTAIALVFSIFHLNPSPFCMLDEVDAPLDDANVGRYTRLVQEMSSVVQFIFITHNRITMEAANQLLGVTMHEPGVSRLVAVDVEEAAELAAM